MSANLVGVTPPILHSDEDSADFRRKINQTCFRFQHGLAGDPLFELDRLKRLAQHCENRAGDLLFDAGEVRVDQKWGTIPTPAGMTAHDAIGRMDSAGAWVIMKHVEQDPDYRRVLTECTNAIFDWTPDPLRKLLKNPEMLVIMNSPGRVTPFHMDRELNFLLQVRGLKTIRIYDRDDRAVITEEELERLYSFDLCAATYKPNIDDRAHLFELTPGKGVHIPVTCPHWVKNGNEMSVSVSINFELPDYLRADLYRVNCMLRRAGLRPSPPGQSAWRDGFKKQMAAGFWKLYPLVARLRGGSRP